MSKKTIILIAFVLLLFAVLAPPAYDVFAQSQGPLVSCGYGSLPDCNLCYLQTLAQNIINWLVYFSVIVATLMFVYAGFTYITAGSDTTKISKAHNVFWRVFIGLIFVLTAWLVIDTIMTTFLDKSWGPWNEIECGTIAYVNTGDNPGNPNAPGYYYNPDDGGTVEVIPPSSDSPTLAGSDTRTQEQKDTDEVQALKDLVVAGKVRVNKEWCDVNERYQDHVGGCTDLSLVSAATIQGINDLQEGCNCQVVVTGGSELGHTGTGSGTHAGGDKYDISKSSAVNAYIYGNDFTDGFDPGGRPAKINNTTGDIFVDEGNHWDVLVK